MANEVSIDISVETQKARKSIERLEKSFSDFTQSATNDVNKATSAIDVFKGSIASAAVTRSLGAITRSAKALFNVFITDGLKAAQVQEDAINRLNIALKASGRFTEQASKDFQEYASSLQAVTKFGDEAILENAALIQSLGQLSQEGLKGATQAALDLSAALGISLNTAATLVGKAATGEIGTFSRYGLAIKKGADEAETFANALDAINSKFGGAAAGQVETFSGASAQLSNTFGDLTETFGFFVTRNDLVVSAIGGLNKAIAELDTFIKNNEASIREFINNGILSALDAIQPLARGIVFLNDVFVGLNTTWDFIKLNLNELTGLFVSASESILQTAKSAGEFIGLDTTGIDEAITSVQNLKEVNQEVTESINKDIDDRLSAQETFANSVKGFADIIESNVRKEIELERTKTAVITEELEKQKEARLASNDEVSEKEQINEKVIELERAKSAKLIDIKAQEIVSLRELEAEENARQEEERLIKVEVDQEQADQRLQLLIDRLGTIEAIESEAEARRLEKEGKVFEAKKKRLAAEQKAEKENIFAIQKFEELSQKQRVANLQSTLGTISTLQSSNNKVLFNVGKAAAIGTATIDGFQAVQKALASAPPPINFVLAAAVGAAAAANVAKIASTPPPSFQDGGIVPGVPTDRDNTFANVASGEVILNRRQQAETLFAIANGNGTGGGGGSINISIDAPFGVPDEQVDRMINAINDRTEFGNQQLRMA